MDRDSPALYRGYFSWAIITASPKRRIAQGDRRTRNRFLRRDILIPMLIHSAYDFIATDESPILSIVFFVYIIIVDIFAFRSLKQYSQNDVNLE